LKDNTHPESGDCTN